MELIFPYEHIADSRFGPIHLPTVKVDFKLDKSWLSIWMIADTGADKTVIPRYLAAQLNISLEKDCIKDKTFGVGGERPIYVLKERFPVKLGKWSRDIPLAILDTDDVPPLMGRLGFMETFDFCFTKQLRLKIRPG